MLSKIRIFKVEKHRTHRNTSNSHASGGAPRFVPPLMVL
jgi:hypothetical protein